MCPSREQGEGSTPERLGCALTAASGQTPTLLRPARGWTTPRLADELALDLVVGQPWYPSGDSLQPGDVLRVSARSLAACLRAIAARNVKAATVGALLASHAG